MTSILHISDPHYQTETMKRLDSLAHYHSDCDVVALTGDCTSSTRTQLPEEWNDWPQRLKLAVPGNHDELDTFDLLDDWLWLQRSPDIEERAYPMIHQLDELVFVGIDTSKDIDPFSNVLTDLNLLYQLNPTEASNGSALVLLTHRWPEPGAAEGMGDILQAFVGDRILLVLHGHKHPWYAEESEWKSSAKIGNLTHYRSKAISSQRQKRGSGHLIVWDGDQFKCSEVQGSRF
jgi:hypothetical protein